jgi:hypothetical protein
MATTARALRPRSAAAATRGSERPPVSARCCGALAEALADGLMEALADGLMEALADGLMEALADGLMEALADGLMEALAEDEVPPPPDTLTLAVISGCIEQWYV